MDFFTGYIFGVIVGAGGCVLWAWSAAAEPHTTIAMQESVNDYD
jgi:hypothetical protein